jgi:thiol:disulfide interchange protein DsbD
VNTRPVLLALLIILGVGIVLANQVLQSQGIEDTVQWVSNYDEGMALAQSTESLVLLEFHADWCGRCRDFEQETWSDPAVIEMVNDEFICIKIDVDLNSTLRNQYHVTSLPTVIVLTSSGDEIDRIGYVTSSEFLDFLTQIINRTN